MKTYTIEEKIEEIKLGIRINNFKIKELHKELEGNRLCDMQYKLELIHAHKVMIRNQEKRIDELINL